MARKQQDAPAVAAVLAAAADPIGAHEARLLSMANAEMKAAGLSTTAPRFIIINLALLRLDPGANPHQVCRPRLSPTRRRAAASLPKIEIPISRREVTEKSTGLRRAAKSAVPPLPARLETPFTKLTERVIRQIAAIKDTVEPKKQPPAIRRVEMQAYRAVVAANLIACLNLKRRTANPRDRELLAGLIRDWLYQLDVERTEENFRREFRRQVAVYVRGPRTHTQLHLERFRVIRDSDSGRSNWKIAADIATECQTKGLKCKPESIYQRLYRAGGPLFRSKV